MCTLPKNGSDLQHIDMIPTGLFPLTGEIFCTPDQRFHVDTGRNLTCFLEALVVMMISGLGGVKGFKTGQSIHQ